jgi:hypothetical protein
LGHTQSVTSAAYSPDGRRIVSASYDNTMKVWDAENGTELRSLSGHNVDVWSVAFSPDGRRIVSTGGDDSRGLMDETVEVWDTETGRLLFSLSGHTNWVYSAAYSPDGRRIVSASYDGTTRLWDVATGNEIAQLVSFDDGEWLCFTPNGYYAASPKGDAYLNVRVGTEVYGIDQYRNAFYKPELVASRLSSGGVMRLADASTASQNAAIQPPQVAILSPTDGGVSGAGTVVLHVHVNAGTQFIKSVRILVNGQVVGEMSCGTSAGASPSPSRPLDCASPTMKANWNSAFPSASSPGKTTSRHWPETATPRDAPWRG